jgi:hypothetical protein
MRTQYEFEMTSKRNGARYTTHADAHTFKVALQAMQDAYGDGFIINPEPIETITNPADFIWTGIHCD